ncbi:Na+/H+ antiporter subunit G [Lujinxingia litoralis]|uniref:Na+/H+ antiporter subunit G n=1 Tax=Lujinxingia litoralis TaxID=2211119 RepID=A0A328C4A8_9DELT|nr:Na+/H+ antiporter subunit G [Lujinxingia litoralis]RAL20779.1 Na+/H+ antiporter subunit G [Lujinxingia litoralis]
MTELPLFIQIPAAALIIIGAFFAFVGSLGLAKLPDFFMRLHGPTKATTLGLGAMLTASMLFFTYTRQSLTLHEVLITLFLFMTAPVSAHILSKAAIKSRLYDSTGMVEEKTRSN